MLCMVVYMLCCIVVLTDSRYVCINASRFVWCLSISVYYTALLNAVECSVHLHGPSRLSAVNYFSIMTVAQHIMTAVMKSGLVTYQPQRIRLLNDVNVFGGLLLC